MDEQTGLREEGVRKRRCSDFGASACASPPKKLKSKSPACSESDDIADSSIPQSNDMTNSCNGNCGLHNVTHPSIQHNAFDLHSWNIHTRLPQDRPPQIDQSSILSPSTTSSPLFSQTSSSTMISSLCNVPEDMEIPRCVLTDHSLFFSQEAKTAQPPADSSVCIETSTSLEPVDVARTSPVARDSTHGQIKYSIPPRNAMSIAVVNSKEAEQILSIDPSLTPSTPTKAAIRNQPTTFADLDEDVQRKIFETLLVKRRKIHPVYRYGMLIEGPWSPGCVDGEMDAGVSPFENINLYLLQVNKHFNKMCSKIFYGQNNFFFDDANICRWWIEHVGLKNFSRLRSLFLGLNSGFFHKKDEYRSPFDSSEEEVWHSVLCWMQNRHRLHYLHVKTIKWYDLERARWLTEEEKNQVYFYRHKIMSVLQRYRGIEEVDVSCDQGRWLTSGQIDTLELLMQQRRENFKKAKELSLFELLNSIRLTREQEEQEELREFRQRQLQYGC